MIETKNMAKRIIKVDNKSETFTKGTFAISRVYSRDKS